MNILEYLKSRRKKSKHIAITKNECDAFGLVWPPKKGWQEVHGKTEVTEFMLERVKSVPRKAKKLPKKFKQPPKYINHDSNEAPWKSGPVKVVKVPSDYIAEFSPPKQRGHVDVNSPEFLTSYPWVTLRMQALKLYGPICMCCGDTPKNGAIMNVDHIKPRRKFPELALRLDNLQILCAMCNKGKSNWDSTDWRDEDPTSKEGLAEYELTEISKILSSF